MNRIKFLRKNRTPLELDIMVADAIALLQSSIQHVDTTEKVLYLYERDTSGSDNREDGNDGWDVMRAIGLLRGLANYRLQFLDAKMSVDYYVTQVKNQCRKFQINPDIYKPVWQYYPM